MPNKWSKSLYLSIFVILMTDGAWGQSFPESFSGEYQSEKLRANLLPRKDGRYDVSIMVNTGICAGQIDFVPTRLVPPRADTKDSAVFVGVVDKECGVIMSFDDYGGLKIVEGSCAKFHGASCDFEGKVKRIGPANPNAAKDYDSIVKRLTTEFTKSVLDRPKQVRDQRSKEIVVEQPIVEGGTRIESSKPARIIIDGEYVGITPLTTILPTGKETLPSGQVIFPSDIVINVLPVGAGCTQLEIIKAGRRPPKRMFFDTRLCPITPSLDVNVR